jgi:hypothetical protein
LAFPFERRQPHIPQNIPKCMATKKKSATSASNRGNRCWPGFTPVKGKKPYSKGSCKKKEK